jgi:DNA-binding transcriptional ArsR family regulator
MKPGLEDSMDPTDLDIDIAALRQAAAKASGLLKALANPDRLLLLCQLTQGERSVGELEQLTGVVQPTLSQQLAVLRSEELVLTRREGKQIFYRVGSQAALALLQVLYQQFCPSDTGEKHDRLD